MSHRIRRSLSLAALTLAAFGSAARAQDVPAAMVGSWIDASNTSTNYWNQDGSFAGNAFSTGQVLELAADGTYKYYILISTTSYNISSVTKITMEGRYTVTGDVLKLTASKGHFNATGMKTIDRDMTEQEMADRSKEYRFVLHGEGDSRGLDFVFSDGSKYDFKPAAPKPGK